MNKETVEGKFDQVAGKIKEKFGEATGNEKLANSGVADQVKGAAKETWGQTKETANEVVETGRAKADAQGDSFANRAEAGAHDLRDKITTAAHNAKEKIAGKLDEIKHDTQRERDNIRVS